MTMLLTPKEGHLRVDYEERTGRCGERYIPADADKLASIVKQSRFEFVVVLNNSGHVVGARSRIDGVMHWWIDPDFAA